MHTGQSPGWSVSSQNEGVEDTGSGSRVGGYPAQHSVLPAQCWGQGEGRPGEGGLPTNDGSLTAPYTRRAKFIENSPQKSIYCLNLTRTNSI